MDFGLAKLRLIFSSGALIWGIWGIGGIRAMGGPKVYDPDPQACQVETIRNTFRSNLLPWADQPPVVQQRLQQLQGAMTLDTMKDCLEKGLLSPEQVTALSKDLGLPMPLPGGKDSSPSPQLPTRP